jgi:hypothetical protein
LLGAAGDASVVAGESCVGAAGIVPVEGAGVVAGAVTGA